MLSGLSGQAKWCPGSRMCAIHDPKRPGSRTWLLLRTLKCIPPVPRPQLADRHSGLPTHLTNVVASPSSWSPQPRVPRRRAASIHYLRSAHITGRGPERYPRESMAVVSVVRVRARDCICGRHDNVKVIFTAAFRHYRNDFSRFRDTLRWGRISGTTWNVWRHCMVCDFPRMRSVVIRYHRTERTISSLGALSAWICLK